MPMAAFGVLSCTPVRHSPLSSQFSRDFVRNGNEVNGSKRNGKWNKDWVTPTSSHLLGCVCTVIFSITRYWAMRCLARVQSQWIRPCRVFFFFLTFSLCANKHHRGWFNEVAACGMYLCCSCIWVIPYWLCVRRKALKPRLKFIPGIESPRKSLWCLNELKTVHKRTGWDYFLLISWWMLVINSVYVCMYIYIYINIWLLFLPFIERLQSIKNSWSGFGCLRWWIVLLRLQGIE